MPRHGDCVYKRKDGRWEARYVKTIGADGKKKYGSVYARTYREVKEKQKQHTLAAVQNTKTRSQLLISDLTGQWLYHIRCRVKLSTYRKYEGLCNNHILPELGTIPATAISSQMIDAFARERRLAGNTCGGELSVKTVNDILIILGLIFDYATEEHQIIMPKITKMREEKQEARVLTAAEQRLLMDYLLTDTDQFKFCIMLALYTGLRIGELCALQWEDVTDDYIVVNKTLQRLKGETGKTEIFVDSPKSDSSKRIVPLPDCLQMHIHCFRKADGYVLCSPRSTHSEPRAVQQRFQKISRLLGLENVTFHTLRHTFATRCVEAGFDVKTLSEILGHSDVKTTLNRYVHSSFETKKRNMEKLSLSAETHFGAFMVK